MGIFKLKTRLYQILTESVRPIVINEVLKKGKGFQNLENRHRQAHG